MMCPSEQGQLCPVDRRDNCAQSILQSLSRLYHLVSVELRQEFGHLGLELPFFLALP